MPSAICSPTARVMFRFELKHLGDFRFKSNAIDNLFGDNQQAVR